MEWDARSGGMGKAFGANVLMAEEGLEMWEMW
jgi:hypothetical protein